MLSFTEPAVTVADADAYIAAGGAAGWPDDDTTKAQALMRGQRYVGSRYNARWLTEWDNNAAPDSVRYAIIEAALVEATKPGSLSTVSNPSTDKVLVQAGKIAWERVKGASGADSWLPRLSSVEGLLAGLVRSTGSGTTFLKRA